MKIKDLLCYLGKHDWSVQESETARSIAHDVGYTDTDRNFRQNMHNFDGALFERKVCKNCGKVINDIDWLAKQFLMVKQNGDRNA